MNKITVFFLISSVFVLTIFGCSKEEEEEKEIIHNLILNEIRVNDMPAAYLKNKDKVTLSFRSNGNNYNLNNFYLDNKPLSVKKSDFPIAVDFVIPNNYFSDERYSGQLKYKQGQDSSVMEIFSNDYPKILSFAPSRVYYGDTLTIEGENLQPKEGVTKILFISYSEKRAIEGKIIFADKYTIKVIVPNNVDRQVLYYNKLGKEKEIRSLIVTNDLYIKK